MIFLLLRFITLTLVASALLTPLAMEGLRLLGDPFGWPFSRVFDRVAMVVVLILVWFERKHFNLSAVKSAFAEVPRRARWSHLVAGMFLTIIMSAATALWLVKAGYLTPKEVSTGYIVKAGLKAILTGVVVSLIEESFFRVLLLRSLRGFVSLIPAVLACSVLYAIAHFITPVKTWEYSLYSWHVGFDYLGAVTGRLLAPGLLPAFVGLVLVGVCLCAVILKTRSVYLCVGLHAGWVVGIKLVRKMTEFAPEVTVLPGAGERYYLVTQPVAWVGVILVGAIAIALFRTKTNRQEMLQTAVRA